MDSLLTPSQRSRLGAQTRERFVLEVGRALAELGGLVQDRLTSLMNEVGTFREMQSRREVWMLYQRGRQAWVEASQKACQSALSPLLNQGSGPKATNNMEDLELLGTETMDSKIFASRLAMEVKEKIGEPIEDLALRIQTLEGAKFDAHDILAPEVTAGFLVEQWGASGMSLQTWPLVHEVVRRRLIEQLKRAYLSCNAFLIEQGVMPTIEAKDRFKHAPVAPPAPNHPAPKPVARPAASPVTQGAEAPTRPTGLTASARHDRPHDRSLIEKLQRLLASHGVRGGAPVVRSPELVAAIEQETVQMMAAGQQNTVVEEYTPEGMARLANQLRQKTQEIKKKAETPSEKVQIEVVALMFQSILAETRISPAIRVWFARLQMPVLREALADPTFVTTLDHPARQLIDRMGSCALGFDAADIGGKALETEIQRVVQVIEQYPDTGKRVFELMLEEFQKFLTKFLVSKGASERLKTVAQQVEQKETLTVQYTIELRKLIQDMQVADAIRSFLFKVWAEVLAVAAVRQGPQHEQTVLFKKLAADLVRVASAKGRRQDRARAMQQLPQLLQSLRAGMSLLGLAAREQESHIKMVSTTLAEAFLSKSQAIPKARLDALAQHLAHLEDFVSDQGEEDIHLSTDNIEEMLGIDASSIEVVADGGSQATLDMMHWAQSLQTGAWLTLDHSGQVSEVQFCWRSEQKHFNLFARTDGQCFLIQARRLAAYLQAGLLVPFEVEPLTMRATRDALSKLEANPERLLS